MLAEVDRGDLLEIYEGRQSERSWILKGQNNGEASRNSKVMGFI
jgi:hypothetical protein